MRFDRRLALLLAPDLHEVARRLSEVEKGLEVAQDWVDRMEERAQDYSDADPVVIGFASMADEARTAIVESRARLIEVYEDLTGRSLEADLNRG